MLIKRVIGFIFAFTFLLLNYSIATENTLENSIAKLMKVEPKQIELKRQTKGMTSSQNYSFELDGKKYVVKIFGKKCNPKYKLKEIEAAKTFSDLGLGSKLVAVGNKNSFYIREYIPGETLEYKDLKDDKVLETLAKAVRKIHGTKNDAQARGLLERAQKHCKKIAKKKIATPNGFKSSYEKFKEMLKSLTVSNGFCHNDLNPHNIILTPEGKIYVIDFGNSGYSNIYEELGYVTLLNGITGEKLERFLTVYYGRNPTSEEISQVKLAQKLVCFVSAAVYFDFSETKKDKKIDINLRQERLDKLLKSNDLRSVMDYIKNEEIVSIKSRKKNLIKRCAVAFYKSFLEM